MTQYTFLNTSENGNTTSLSFEGEEYEFWPEVLAKFMVFLSAQGFIGVDERIAIKEEYAPIHSWSGLTFTVEKETEEDKDGADNWHWYDSEDEAPW